jgi:glycosyltransferase involved in cell wall biosynthesis/O-antigen/teichoic acid export membrane protein
MGRSASVRLPSKAVELLRGALPLLLAVGLQNGSNFLFHIAVSRMLGPTSYGALAAILAIALVISVPFGVVQAVAAKRASVLRASGREAEITDAAARGIKGTALVGIGLALLFLVASPLLAIPLHLDIGPVVLLAPFLLFTLILGVPLGVLQGRLRFGALGAVVLVAVGVRLGLGVGLVAAGWGVPGAVVASTISQGVALALALALLSVPREVWSRARPSLAILRGGFAPALFGFGAFWLVVETDLVLARHFLGERDAGLFSAAGLLARALLFLPAAICWVALPRFAETGGRGEAARRWLRGAIGVTLVLTAAALVAIVLLRDWVVELAFGSRFLPAADLLPVLGIAMALFSVANLLVYFHVAAESRAWQLLLFGVVAEIGLVSVFHGSPEQIALVVVSVAAFVTLLQYQAASAILRWSPPASKLATYEEVGGRLSVPEADLSVVIPCHNGGPGLGALVEKLSRELGGIPSEIVVVSDGSTDETARVAERVGLEGVRVLHYPRRMGKGHALRVGLAEARGRYVAFMDADGDIDPEGLRPFLSLMELYHPDIVLGSKRHPMSDVHYPPVRRILSWTYHKLGRVLFRVTVRDTQTGLKLIRRDVLAAVLPRMLEKRYAFDLEMLVVARMLGYTRVFEAPVRIDYRFSSHVDLRAAFRILLDTLAIFYRRFVLDTYRRDPRPAVEGVGELAQAFAHRFGSPTLEASNGHLRVLFLNWRDITNPEAGGAEVYTHEVARRWVEQGHQVSLLTSRFSGSSQAETVDGVRIRRMGRLRNGSFHVLVQRELARLSGFDVVIDEINTIPFLTPLWGRRLPPVVTLIHQLAVEVWDAEVPRPLAAIGRRLEPRLLRLYEDAPVVTVSESTRGDLQRLGLRNVHVVPVGLEMPPELDGVSKEEAPTFLFVGRLTPNKRPDHAVQAFRTIRERVPEARMWIVGRGPMEGSLRDQLPPGAEMLGYLPRPELYERMARAHCLLVTSVREGWGMVITEANSVGTPAVGYDVPGVRDAISHGETGRLVEAGNEADLGEAALMLIGDSAVYSSHRMQALARSQRFSWDRTADELFCRISGRMDDLSLTPASVDTLAESRS